MWHRFYQLIRTLPHDISTIVSQESLSKKICLIPKLNPELNTLLQGPIKQIDICDSTLNSHVDLQHMICKDDVSWIQTLLCLIKAWRAEKQVIATKIMVYSPESYLVLANWKVLCDKFLIPWIC